MKAIVFRLFVVLGFIYSPAAFAQCEIKNKIYPDGMMLYFIEPVNFYWTKSKSLEGGIVTDKENFYLALCPLPFPPKPEGRKLKDLLEIRLSNDSVHRLEHFDTRYMDHDTVMQLLYLLDKERIEEFLQNQVFSVRINMQGTEGMRTYVFKLHKSALSDQLKCLIEEKENKKKKEK